MRLKSVFISDYKNLRNFELDFDGTSFIDVFVGRNGSGKSNLFEALIEVFRHLIEFDKGSSSEIPFDYRVSYEIDGRDTAIEWKAGQLSVNGSNRKTLGGTPVPDNVLIYYSGHNTTVASLVADYENTFRRRIRNANLDESRRFLGIGQDYKSLLLSVLLSQPTGNKAREFIFQKLGIERLGIRKPGLDELSEPVIRLVLKRPDYASGKREFDVELNDESDRYWKVDGIAKTFIDRISNCIVRAPGNMTVSEGYFPADDQYIHYLDIAKLQQEFSGPSAKELFRQFDNLKILGMLDDIAVPLQLLNGVDATVAHFSDGQFQSVYIYAIVELFKDRNCVTLLDEPDAFLHPEWQFEFLKQVFEITETAAKNNHVLMSSHSAATLCGFDEQQIRLLKIESASAICVKRSKKDVIHELSDSFIQYSEDESKLLIDNVIRSSLRPILFVEGPSDVSILNTAHKKLYPNEDISILIQDAFDRGFIKTLLARNEIFATYPDKQFFALFDFDDAYEDWRTLGGTQEVGDIGLGLCRKLPGKNAHTFLLPVLDNDLKTQVWDEANPIEKIVPKPHYCIEHVFWGEAALGQWFRIDDGNGLVRFKGDKVRFAKNAVPQLPAASFEPFRPMFELIRAKSATI